MHDKGHTTRAAFRAATSEHVPTGAKSATARAEQHANETGELNPLVDPKGFGVIRRSLPRFVEQGKLWELAVGLPVPIETRVDTTGSMGDNVDIALRVMPDAFELATKVLPGCDPQIATGIFGDVTDVPRGKPGTPLGKFTLGRPQFEMDAAKIVEQLTLMVPIRQGRDDEEDPHYGLFGAAYLTATYIQRIGLKGYDFTISDAPARMRFGPRFLKVIFGDEVFEKVAENGHTIDLNNLPDTREVVVDLLKRSHAFFLQVDNSYSTTTFWTKVFGASRVVMLPSTELAPQVQATIIGLTEGTLDLQSVPEFLRKSNVDATDIRRIVTSVSNIPIGAQSSLPNFAKRPQKGDLFREKTDLWPIGKNELGGLDLEKPPGGKEEGSGPKWL